MHRLKRESFLQIFLLKVVSYLQEEHTSHERQRPHPAGSRRFLGRHAKCAGGGADPRPGIQEPRRAPAYLGTGARFRRLRARPGERYENHSVAKRISWAAQRFDVGGNRSSSSQRPESRCWRCTSRDHPWKKSSTKASSKTRTSSSSAHTATARSTNCSPAASPPACLNRRNAPSWSCARRRAFLKIRATGRFCKV